MAPSAPASVPATVDDVLNSVLSSPQFTVASYLNVAFSEASSSLDTDDLQRRMAELALQLQLQTQSCHEDIGKIGAELQAILPRCAADVGRVGVGLEGMRMDAQSLMETTTAGHGQHELSSSLETLSTLHALQSNLSRTKQVLTAAATWDSTLATIPPLLAQQNLPEAVHALGQLEHGERALRGMPHPQERQAQILKIRNQVQVLLQPQLKHALQNMNTRLAPLQQCVSLYSQLGKIDSLQAEYVKNRPGAIHKAWFAFSPSYNSGEGEGMEHSASSLSSSRETLLTWLPSWYDSVLSLLMEERRQSLSVFGPEMAPEILVKVRKLHSLEFVRSFFLYDAMRVGLTNASNSFCFFDLGLERMFPSHSPILSKSTGIAVLVESRCPGQGIVRVGMCHLRIDPPILVGNLRIGRGRLFGCRRGWVGQKGRQWGGALPRNDCCLSQGGQSLF
jgi:hypothetical protein